MTTYDAKTRIVGVPTPKDDGTVVFSVDVQGQVVEVCASPLGAGCAAEVSLELANAATREVFRYIELHAADVVEMYRAAGRLRRAAGKPPLAGTTPPMNVHVSSEPDARRNGVILATESEGARVRVLISPTGEIVDHCDDWDGVTDTQRDAAIAAALRWVFANRQTALSLGLDVSLLEDLWLS